MSITIRVHGTPAPQGSKVRTRYGMREASKKVAPWREAVVSQIMRQGLQDTRLGVPLSVQVTFYFNRPKAHYGTMKGQPYLREDAPMWVAKTPDIDKCLRSTFDALTQSGLIEDDALIVIVRATQRYVAHGQSEGALIEVMPAGGSR